MNKRGPGWFGGNGPVLWLADGRWQHVWPDFMRVIAASKAGRPGSDKPKPIAGDAGATRDYTIVVDVNHDRTSRSGTSDAFAASSFFLSLEMTLYFS